MGLVWNPVTVPGLLAFFVAVAASTLVYLARPDRTQNRYLALVLFLEGVAMGTGSGWMYVTDNPSSTFAWQSLTVVAVYAMNFAYLLLLSTLETPIVRFLSTRAARAVLWAGLVLSPVAAVLLMPETLVGVKPGTHSPWQVEYGPLWAIAFNALILQSLIGLIVAIFNLKSASKGPLKRQAWAFFTAFAFRDVMYIVTIYFYAINPGIISDVWAGIIMPSMIVLVYLPILAIGILRTQLFGIESKIHFTINKTTIAAVFIAVFVAVQTLVSEFVAEEAGLWAGAIAAGFLFFALSPLQRLAERFADKAVPRGRSSGKLSPAEKSAFYREQVEIAYSDGSIGHKERNGLKSVRERIGLSAAAALKIEDAVVTPA